MKDVHNETLTADNVDSSEYVSYKPVVSAIVREIFKYDTSETIPSPVSLQNDLSF